LEAGLRSAIHRPEKSFANFWPVRKESTFTKQVQPSHALTSVAQAQDIMRPLGLRGETALNESPSPRANP